MNEIHTRYRPNTSANAFISGERYVFDPVSRYFFDFVSRLTEYINSTLEHFILFCAAYVVLCVLLYVTFTFTKSVKNPKRVLFIISHPDDEVMFFGPTVLHFINKTDSQVYLICLSTGKNYGIGEIRKRELYDSCKVLGLKPENIMVFTSLADQIDLKWPMDVVEKLILTHVEQFDIDVLVTFDRYGVSRHLNHCSTYFAVANLIMDKKLPKYCKVYVLETVNIIRKYWLILDIPLTYLMSRIRYIVNCKERHLIHKAMRQHKSQLVWFRRIYMIFSRYMLINSLQRMDLTDIELDLEIDD